MINRVVDGADENNWRGLAALALQDQSRGFKSIHSWHVHVEEDCGEILLQQLTQRLFAGSQPNDVLVQVGQHDFISEKLVGPAVDDEATNLLVQRTISGVI